MANPVCKDAYTLMHVLGGQVAIVKLSVRYHAKIAKMFNFLFVKLSGSTV